MKQLKILLYNLLHLHDMVVDSDASYKAKKIILGENVVVKSGTKLTLAATDEIEVRSNVECEPGAEFEFKH